MASGHEIPLMPAGVVAKSHPDYFTIELPYFERQVYEIDSANKISIGSIRLNSIQDPIQNSAFGHVPLGRDAWTSIYGFYRVISTDVTLTWYYEKGEFTTASAHGEITGEGREAPLIDATNAVIAGWQLTDSSSDIYPDGATLVEGKHSKAELMFPTNIHARTDSSFQDHSLNCYGGALRQTFHYSPEEWNYHVQNSSIEDFWTAVGSNPATDHLICPTVAYANNDHFPNTGVKIGMSCWIHIKYRVQFREVLETSKKVRDE
jgi:hypothetical protein